MFNHGFSHYHQLERRVVSGAVSDCVTDLNC